ncbi:MAG: FtsB family cell division protein [Terriglobales bacterium]
MTGQRPTAVFLDGLTRAARGIYHFRTKLATVAVAALAVLLAMHVIFGANGMVVYQKKRAEFQSLQKDVDQLQKENQAISDQIHSLKTDPQAIEKEAREQLHYARPGEVVYLAPAQPNTPPPNATAKK